MKIGILGAGFIGGTLASNLRTAGHDVKLANSRGADTIEGLAAKMGVRAVVAAEAVTDVDVIILSIPLKSMPALRPLFAEVPAEVPVIDTSNYYPARDGQIRAIDEGQEESAWVGEQIGHAVTKVWNAVLAGTLRTRGMNKGEPSRIAIPVAGDDAVAKRLAMRLVDGMGFEPFDAGGTADSWKIQPGQPTYCTELTIDQMMLAMTLVDRDLAARRRDLGFQIVMTFGEICENDDILRINRAIMRFPK